MTLAYEKSVEVITTPNQLSWKDGVDMNTGRADMGVAAVRSRIYVVGGVKESDKSRMEYFCSVTQQWTYVDIEVPHRDFRGVAVDDELVYLIGGDDVTTYNVYNPACSRKGWKQLPGANTADVVCLWKRSAIAAVDSVIYCIGGAFQGQRMATVSSYSTVTGIWNHACSTCTSKRANAKAVVLKMC